MTETLQPPTPTLGDEITAAGAVVVSAVEEPITAPRRHTVLRALLHGRGLAGLILVGVVFLAGLLAPVIAPFDLLTQLRDANLLAPSGHHLFGTDEVNRDVFSRALYGIRVDVIVVFVAVPIGALIGSLLGMIATMIRPADVAVQRIFDVLLSFPPVILAIGVTAVTGTGLFPVLLVVTFVEIPVFGRLVRASILKVRELPFVQSAEVIGASRTWIMRRHILPNAAEPLLVQLALSMSVAIFLESAMSFIGIGVRPPSPSLGSIIAGAVNYLDTNPMYAVGPLLIVTLLVLGFQLIAQAIGAQRRR